MKEIFMSRGDKGTRQKLIDTVTDLLWTSSYGAVSVDDICREAGVKKGSFYHYFPSKQHLAVTAMEEYYDAYIKPDMDHIFAANISFHEQLSALADSILDEQREVLSKYGLVCGCPMAALACEMIGEENAPIAEKIGEMFNRCKSYIHTAIERAMDAGIVPRGDANVKADEIHDFITGLMTMARVHNSLDGLERDLKPGMMRILGLDNPQPIKQKNY